jgi:protein-disulfide isomerase
LRYPRTGNKTYQGGQNDHKLESTFSRNCPKGSGERSPLKSLAKLLLVAGLSVGIGFTAPAEAHAPLAQLVKRTPEAAQKYAQKVIKNENWGSAQWKCLKSLWTAESNWRPDAFNKTPVYQVRNGKRVKLHAGGIPQKLNLDPDTSVEYQINEGILYIKSRYSNPCNAWRWHTLKNWY